MMFFKRPEYRRFEYKPRFYDPKKEAREERLRRVRAELGLEDKLPDKEKQETYVPDLRGKFRSEFERRRAARSNVGSWRTLRLFMILMMLFILAFYWFVKNPDSIMRLFGL